MQNKNLLALIMALLMTNGLGNNANAEDFNNDVEIEALLPEEMDSLRGGFLMAGGMVIDFSILRQSSINGQMQQQLNFNSKDLALNELQSNNFRGLMQLGSKDPAMFKQMPNMTTVIRNNQDNALIQNLNMLDVTVKNTEATRNSMALNPLRDIHLLR